MYPQEAEFHELLQISGFFFHKFFFCIPKMVPMWVFSWEKANLVEKQQSFHAATWVCFRSYLSSNKWLELLQKWSQIPLRGCIAAKRGVNDFLQHLWQVIITHLETLAESEGLWSGRVNCSRLLTADEDKPPTCLSTWSRKVARRLSSPRALAPLSVIRRKRASDKRQIFQNAKAFALSTHTILLFLSFFVAWLLKKKLKHFKWCFSISHCTWIHEAIWAWVTEWLSAQVMEWIN